MYDQRVSPSRPLRAVPYVAAVRANRVEFVLANGQKARTLARLNGVCKIKHRLDYER